MGREQKGGRSKLLDFEKPFVGLLIGAAWLF